MKGCRTGSRLACLNREDIAVFVGKECCVRFFQAIEKAELSPLPPMLCSSQSLLRSSGRCLNQVRVTLRAGYRLPTLASKTLDMGGTNKIWGDVARGSFADAR